MNEEKGDRAEGENYDNEEKLGGKGGKVTEEWST